MKKSITTVQRLWLSTLLVLFISIQGYAQTNLAAWNPNGLSTFGPASWNATTKASNVNLAVVRRGSGVATTGTAAASAWGGVGFTSANAATAVSTNRLVTFELSAQDGYVLSLNQLDLRYRRSGSGPETGELYYAIDNGTYTKITNLSFSSSSSGGASHSAIALSSYEDLQNIPSTSSVTFRIIPLNGGGSGTWYIWGTGLVVNGKVEAAPIPATPTLTASATTLSDFGRVCVGASSTEQSFSLTGSDLEASDIHIQKLAGYQFATVQEGPYADSLILSQNGGTYTQDIFVQFAPKDRQVYSEDIVVAATGLDNILIAATGTGTAPTASIEASRTSICAGDSTVLTTLASDGTAPYTYQWTVTDQSLSDLNIGNPTARPADSGTYEVIVSDTELCTTFAEITISVNPSIRLLTATPQDISCNGETNGAISLVVDTEATNLSFAWSGSNDFSAATQNLSDLSAGQYKVIVTTEQQCSDSTTASIIEPSVLGAIIDSLSHPSCPTCTDGYLRVANNGGTAPYSILWDNQTDTTENKELAEGAYCATITDANGCSVQVCEQLTGITTGITATNKGTTVKIYPNPSNGEVVYIALSSETQGRTEYTVVFYDLTGKVANTITLSTTERILAVAPKLSNGMYLYQLKAEEDLLGSGYLQISR